MLLLCVFYYTRMDHNDFNSSGKGRPQGLEVCSSRAFVRSGTEAVSAPTHPKGVLLS